MWAKVSSENDNIYNNIATKQRSCNSGIDNTNTMVIDENGWSNECSS